MRLVPARALSEAREEESNLSGKASRRARRRYRKARRETRDQEKAKELRQKARSLEQGGKRRKKKNKGKAAAEEEPQQQPRRFPGGPPGRLRERLEEAREEAPAELEPVEDEEMDPEEVFPEDEGELGAEGWGPQAKLGRRLRLQAQDGYRAAVIQLRPGLYLVAEVTDATTRPELGFVPLLAPLIVRSATRALQRRETAQAEPANPGTSIVRRDPAKGELVPAANVGWAEPDDVAAVLGCEICDHKRR